MSQESLRRLLTMKNNMVCEVCAKVFEGEVKYCSNDCELFAKRKSELIGTGREALANEACPTCQRPLDMSEWKESIIANAK